MSDLPQSRNLIGGALKPARSGALLDSVNPATGEVWARIPASDRDDVDEAVAAAKAAFPAWSALPPAARSVYLKQVAGSSPIMATSSPVWSRPTTARRCRSASSHVAA